MFAYVWNYLLGGIGNPCKPLKLVLSCSSSSLMMILNESGSGISFQLQTATAATLDCG